MHTPPTGGGTMAKTNTPSDASTDLGRQFGTDVSAWEDDVKSTTSDLTRTAADRLDETRGKAADGIEGAASVLQQGANRLPGERLSNLASTAADRLNSTADYVRENDVNRMMADVGTLVRNNPGPALVIAAAFGFLIGRAVMRD
jgi:ElaB/YqjD/DUF883 family membrane-anchored ribosome-binding protein